LRSHSKCTEQRICLPRASYNSAMRISLSVRVPGLKAAAGVLAFLFAFCAAALAGKDFVMPTAQAARSYPAHDEHPTEKITMAVDPYDMADKSQIFSTNFSGYGYLPIFFVVTNDGDQPVAL